MASTDGLLSNNDYETAFGDQTLKVNEFKPHYQGRRRSSASQQDSPKFPPKGEETNINPQASQVQNQKVKQGKTVITFANETINERSIMIDRSELNISKSNHQVSFIEDLKTDEGEVIPDDENWKYRKFFWRFNDTPRVRWDLFIMSLTIWHCFSVPFEFAFEPPVFETVGMQLFNLIVNFIFMADIPI